MINNISENSVLISILVPIYNVGKYIERCAVSLFEQSYEGAIEYVFVDDCSPDDSVNKLRNVLANYPQRTDQVKIIAHNINRGLSNARNTALLNATGKYIMHIDSDDYIDTDMVKLMLDSALKQDADMVVCDINNVYQDRIARTKVIVDSDVFQYLSSILTRRTPVCLCGRMIKREILSRNNVISISGLNHGEDYATVPRIIFYCKCIAKVDKALYNYVRYNVGSYTHCIDEKAINDIIWANQLLIDFFTKPGLNMKLPLAESQAINAITLFYCSSSYFYEKITNTYSGLDIRSLNIGVLHKLILLIARYKMYHILASFIKIINMVRS